MFHDNINPHLFQGKSMLECLGKAVGGWLESFLSELGVASEPLIHGNVHASSVLEGRVYVAEGALVEPHAYIQGPCYIGPHAQVRHGAYVRGMVYVGEHAVVGHATEVKASTFLDHAKAGHFAYVGDSLLGRDCNLGAGTKLANLKLTGSEVYCKDPVSGQRISSGLRKFGAILGDRAQTGCNAVLSPGTILGAGAMVMPVEHARGTILQKARSK